MMASNKRILSALGNSPTRRNLFGPVDREQLQRDYQAALHKDLVEASSRWNFDFISDQPLESGDFQWEGIPVAKVPLLYRSCVLDVAQTVKARDAAARSNRAKKESVQNEKENVPCSPERYTGKLEKLEKTPEKNENTGLKRKQTNITGTDLDHVSLNE